MNYPLSQSELTGEFRDYSYAERVRKLRILLQNRKDLATEINQRLIGTTTITEDLVKFVRMVDRQMEVLNKHIDIHERYLSLYQDLEPKDYHLVGLPVVRFGKTYY